MKTPIIHFVLASSLVFSLAMSTADAKKGGTKIPISSSAGPNGKIKPSGTKQAKLGGSLTFTITPATGFHGAVVLDGQYAAFTSGQTALRFTLSNITAPHTVQAVFIPLTSSFAGSNNIAIIGFGNSNQVTNTTPAAISGTASADIGLQGVQGLNVTTGAPLSITGTTSWSANVPLALGDNLLRFTSTAIDGSQSQIETTITYYPTLDFTSALEANHTILFTNEFTPVNFTIGVKQTAGAVVTLFSTDSHGMITGTGIPMADDGVLPDEIQSDGVFTGGTSPDTSATGFQYFRVGVTRGGSTFYSEVVRIWVTTHFVNGQIDTAVTLANNVKQIFDTATMQGQPVAAAAAAALNALHSDPNVGVADATPEHGVWWVSQDGILGFYHPLQLNEKSGGGGSANGVTARPPVTATNTTPHQIKYYTNRKQNPSELGSPRTSGVAVPPDNRIKSRKGILVSPYINNPKDPTSNFGQGDDYFVPWQIVKAAGINSCKLYDATEVLNNGSNNVTSSSFANVSDYGYIHFSTHGDNFYNGLLSLWKDVWGPNDFLKGSLSQVIVYSGEVLPKNPDGTWNFAGFEEDVKAHRVAIFSDGSIALLPGFFSYYLSDLPNSLVVLASCRSAYNTSLISVFLNYNAGAVIGFSDYVKTSYAQNTLKTVLQDLYMDKRVLEASVDAVTMFGPSDADSDPAFFSLYGAADLKLSGPNLENGGFEDGTLSGWSPLGDGRVIRQLGSTLPTAGSFMGIISTGLGFTVTDGSIRQDFCLPANATTLNFDWNFFSEEFLEFCGSEFQDFFNVTLYELDSNGIPVNSHLLFHRQIDDLCCCVTKSDVGFDQGDVYNTGWLTSHLDVSAYKGEHVIIEFSAGDIGDSIYDTAILLDQISISTSTP
jgi:hypothetical protein